MQIGVLGHIVGPSEKSEFKYAITYILSRIQKIGQSHRPLQIHTQVSKTITWKEINTGTMTILEIRADLVPKEYHSLLSPVLAYRSVDAIRLLEDYRNVMINLYSARVAVGFCVYRMRWLHKELEYMACHGVKCVNVFNHMVSKYKTSCT